MESHAGWFLEHAWIIPAVMVGSFVTILFFGKRFSERVTSGIGIFAVAVCLVLSFGVAVQWIQRTNHPPEVVHHRSRGRARHPPSGDTPAASVVRRRARRAGRRGPSPQPRRPTRSCRPWCETTTWFKWSNNEA